MSDLLSKIDSWVRWIAGNPYIGVAGFVIGVASLVYAYYVARRDRKTKALRCRLVSNNIIRNSESLFPKLDARYEGKTLTNLTVTNVLVGNVGKEVIRPHDIAQKDPLRVGVRSERLVRLLDYGVVYASDPHNNVQLERVDENTAQIQFDFIEPRDRATIQLLHTGQGSEDIAISGTVIDAKKPFVPEKGADPTLFDRPFQRFLLGHPRLVVCVPGLAIASVFGVLAYLLWRTSIVLAIPCLVPFLWILWITARVATRRRLDPQSLMVSDSLMQRMVELAIESVSRSYSQQEPYQQDDQD